MTHGAAFDHGVGETSGYRTRPRRVDEFMRQLNIANADILSDRRDEIVGFGETIYERIRVQR
jgi:hypothetical protein